MNTKIYRHYQGTGRWGSPVMMLGGMVLVISLLLFLLAPLAVRSFTAFPAALGVFLLLYGLTARCSIPTGRLLRHILLGLLALALLVFAILEIVVLTGEGILERGTHDQLLARQGLYASLYQSQFRGL